MRRACDQSGVSETAEKCVVEICFGDLVCKGKVFLPMREKSVRNKRRKSDSREVCVCEQSSVSATDDSRKIGVRFGDTCVVVRAGRGVALR